MRKVVLAVICFILVGYSWPAQAENVLGVASQLISQQKYDAAIDVLEGYVAQNKLSAEAYFLLAQAYHWKKELNLAKVYYFKAAEFDRQYRLDVVPLLDELKEWENIITVVEPEIRAGTHVGPSILGALATSYRELQQNQKASKLITYLETTTYNDPDDKDYKNYILAYASLWSGDKEAAKTRLKRIKNRAYLRYARTHEKFRALFEDPEFIEITK